ncbi:MAG: tRNA (adenosine(37)-N6)-threonylcarbamoyltransferase complex transferase subunit TsaD [Candidatus Levybacteria bacterium]|nr:tRNA (adenosine(37)-N6)-threonylcarbamoyltransferase complex transferase subunit TsaD [Candidatus Levybacteria bacterium]
MHILAIESSCDETSAAIVKKTSHGIDVLSTVTATSLSLHAATGGIIPESAARMQVKYIMPVIIEALNEGIGNRKQGKEITSWKTAREVLKNDIDAIAVTYGPGLIGSLLVGVETAKTLSYIFKKPLIPVNHLLAHIYANYINRKESEIKFPYIGLIVSGGHTDLLLFKNHGDYKWLGGTRDDAAGEAFDKIGRLLNLTYPAGPEIEQRASLVNNPDLKFKSPLMGSHDFDFSFSGLKTEVSRFVQKQEVVDTNLKNKICHATQKAIIDVLVGKTLEASTKYNATMILVGGGVSANGKLRDQLSSASSIPVLFPDAKYTTDNAAMIGAYGLLNQQTTSWELLSANPELYFA